MICVIPTMRSIKVKFFIVVLLVLAVYLFLFYLFFEVWVIKKSCPSVRAKVELPLVVVHLDLKGAPPKLSYLENLLPILQENGANGLLIEYEDMFPYSGKLKNISSKNCYDKQELRKFMKKAVRLGFEVIPLIQTFGHMEHVLKLKEFSHMREIPEYPDSLCAAKQSSRALIKHMIEQVMDFHMDFTTLRYMHVGCDEVQHYYSCQQCISKWPNIVIEFAEHIQFVADTISSISSVTTTLIWDDMMRHLPPIEWNKLNYFRNLEPVVWDYSPTLRVSNINLHNLHNKFFNIWIATAFKGADGKTASVPMIRDRFSNHFSWMNFIHNYKFGGERKFFQFSGIILTGWSRYSHMDPLCELLPVSIPSLILNLQLISKFKKGIYYYSSSTDIDTFYNKYLRDKFNTSFKCNLGANLSLKDMDIESCEFEVGTLYNLVNQYLAIKNNYEKEYISDKNAYSSMEYYAKSKYINMNNVRNEIKWLNDTLIDLVTTGDELAKIMRDYYEDFVIEEYVNSKLFGLVKTIKFQLDLLSNYSSTHVWERNPTLINNNHNSVSLFQAVINIIKNATQIFKLSTYMI